MADQDVQTPTDLLNKLSQALIQVSRGDPIVALRNEFETRFGGVETRFSGIEKATELQHQDMVRVPTQVDRAVDGLRDLLKAEVEAAFARVDGKIERHIAQTDERFIAVGSKFTDIAKFTTEKAGDTKLAVDAAFMAAKAETAKIEAGLTKLIDGQTVTIDNKTSNLDGRINDLKDQITTIQGRASVADPHLAQALSSLGGGIDRLQESFGRSMTKMAEATADSIRDLAKSLRTVERSEDSMSGQRVGVKDAGMRTMMIVMAIAAFAGPVLTAIGMAIALRGR